MQDTVKTYQENAAKLNALFTDYALGLLDSSTHALVEAHLYLKEDHRQWVRDIEILASDTLCHDRAHCELSEHIKHSMFDSILSTKDNSDKIEKKKCNILPPALLHHFDKSLDEIEWKNKIGGFKEWHFENDEHVNAELLYIKEGRRMPSHTHQGTEITLVLQGGFKDETGHYQVGDIAIADEDINHRPIADKGDDCLCFSVSTAPITLTGPLGRLIEPFRHH